MPHQQEHEEMRFFIAIAAFYALAGPALAQQPGTVNLDRFLGGIERCHSSPAFEAFQNSLVERFANNFGDKTAKNDTRVQIVIPQDITPGFGTAVTKLHEEFTEVTVPVSGTFQGLGVVKITFGFGNENGIGWRSVEFAVPVAELKKRYARSLAAAQKKNNTGEGGEVSFMVAPKAPATILCDFSN